MAFFGISLLFLSSLALVVWPIMIFVAYATYRKTGGYLTFRAWLHAMGIIW